MVLIGARTILKGPCMGLIEDEENFSCMFLIWVRKIEFQGGARGFDWGEENSKIAHACFEWGGANRISRELASLAWF